VRLEPPRAGRLPLELSQVPPQVLPAVLPAARGGPVFGPRRSLPLPWMQPQAIAEEDSI